MQNWLHRSTILCKKKSIVPKDWDRAGITQLLKVDSALKQEDPFMMLQIELE